MICWMCVSEILQGTVMSILGVIKSYARLRDVYIARISMPYFY